MVIVHTAFALLIGGHEPGDAAIAYAVVQNTAHGHFMRWNPGAELATGVSSPFYVLFLVPAYLASPGPETFPFVVKVVNHALTVGLVALTTAFLTWMYGAGLAAAVAVLLLAPQLALVRSAMGGFETPLALCAIVAATWLALAAAERIKAGERYGLRLLAAGAVLAVVPLTRLEGMLVVVPLVAAVVMELTRRRPPGWGRALAVFVALCLVPAMAWALYAWMETGYAIPTSGLVRRNQLRQAALARGVPFASASWMWHYAAYLVVIACGAVSLVRRRSDRATWFGAVGIVAFIGLVAHFTVVFPAAQGAVDSAARHLLLVVFLGVLFVPAAIATVKRVRHRATAIAVAGLIGLAAIPTARFVFRTVTRDVAWARTVARDPQPPMFMMQPELSGWVNATTPPDATVLLFEIEARYLMRRRVIDLEGYMGGLALPYVRPAGGSDFTGFLARYRPQYWVVDRSITTKPMFRSTILERAVHACRAPGERLTLIAVGCTHEESGIRFRLVKLPPDDQLSRPELYGYRGVFALSYGAGAAARTSGP